MRSELLACLGDGAFGLVWIALRDVTLVLLSRRRVTFADLLDIRVSRRSLVRLATEQEGRQCDDDTTQSVFVVWS